MVGEPDSERPAFDWNLKLAPKPTSESEHLLKVAASVVHDASGVWSEMWHEFRPYVTPGGVVRPEMQKGFVPACGWSEFLEKLWLLKHYLDSAERICRGKH